MLLVMDIGNSSTAIGVFEKNDLLNKWWLSTVKERTCDEIGILIKEVLLSSDINPKHISNAVISSVVPPLTASVNKAVELYFNVKPIVVGPGIKTGISIKYEYPREVGADRIVNAVAGYHIYGGPLIIVDFGTATTFCVISEKGEYLGGVIAPGMTISMEALYLGASKLPRVDMEKPSDVIGKNTIASMQSGVFYGFTGLVREIIIRINSEKNEQHKVIATGEMAEMIAAETTSMINFVDKLLTLKGLKIIYDKNEKYLKNKANDFM
jgi:type III pantothenate kinase